MPIVEQDDRIRIIVLALGPYETNSYILICEKTRECVIVDAPGQAGEVLKVLEGITPRYILMTHNHMDHIGALSDLKKALDVPIAAHPADAPGLPEKPDILLSDGDTVDFGNIRLDVLHTPGHTPGSLCFLTDRFLISGDTLFPGGPGKTASGAALRRIMDSITGKLLNLPLDTRIYPGHGESTTLEREKPAIVAFCSRAHDPDLCGDVLWESS
jgi:glyoxylase-like metal-dependent hydrolase (beta-lactamase superfamily II)